jgi:selenocysteine-specific elongation factor
MTMGQIKEMLSTTRKFAVPLCEYLDRIGFTRRNGDMRVLTASSQAAASNTARQ